MNKILQFIKFLVFPPRCVFCAAASLEETGPCKNCADKVPLIVPPVCERCGAVKGECSCKGRRLGYARCVGVVKYEGLGAAAVLNLKRTGDKSSVKRLSLYMAAAVKREYSDIFFDAVAYVPMHKRSIRERGFNQAALLAKELSLIIGAPLIEALIKNRHTKPQKACRHEERFANVLGAFDINDYDFKDKTVLLVDDVTTSGATLAECSKTLLLAGAKSVYAVVCAITHEKKKASC